MSKIQLIRMQGGMRHFASSVISFTIPAIVCSIVLVGIAHAQAVHAPRLPTDRALRTGLRTGTLPNGLRYYLRHNETPKGRVELRLVVNAGSILEDDDQRGLAHFVEHLAFNGSTHFPHQGIIDYIERAGMTFGSDLNASTSYDETIYDLSLPAEPAILDTALLIMDDWAHGVTMEPAAVEKERGIIFEERRLHQGPQERIQDLHAPVLLGPRYASRSPIGLGETILHAPRSAIWRFYHDWYRPDLETIIVVGDVDVKTMEAKIVAKFGRIPKRQSPRERPPVTVIPYNGPVASVVADADAGGWTANVDFPKGHQDTVETEVTYRQHAIDQVFYNIVNERLRLLAEAKNPLISSATLSSDRLGRNLAVHDLNLTAKEPTTLELGITAAVAEVARIARDGVTANELARERKLLVERATGETLAVHIEPSHDIVGRYIQAALNHRPVADPRAEAIVRLKIAPTINTADVQAVAASILATRGPIVLATVPKNAQYSPPERSALLDALTYGMNRTLPAYSDSMADGSLFSIAPPAGHVVRQEIVSGLGVTEWRLSNGARVLLKSTPFQKDVIDIRAASLGGTSVASDRNYPNAAVASDLVQASGVGPYDTKTLEQRTAGVIRHWNVAINPNTEEVGVSGSPRHLRSMFQLLYLTFTAPRLDTTAVSKWRFDARRNHLNHFDLEVKRLRTQRNPRARPIAGAIVDSVNVDSAFAFYQSRFADAGHFTFVIVGDFNADSIRPLVEQYIGGLPGHASDTADRVNLAPSGARDVGIRPPSGIVQSSVVGEDSASTTETFFDVPMPYTLQQVDVIQSIDAMLGRRVRLRLREQLGGAYSPGMSAAVTRLPYAHATATFNFTSSPERAEELQRALLAVIDTFTTQGPTPAEVRDANELLRRRRQAEMQENESVENLLLGATKLQLPLEEVAAWERQSVPVTAAMIQETARQLFTLEKYIVVSEIPVRLVPSRRDELMSAQQW